MKNTLFGTKIVTCLLLLSGCTSASTPTDRYKLENDTSEVTPISVENVEDAEPRYEPFSIAGIKDYSVRGKRYQVIKDPKGFTQTGHASWYGKKFHGHLTSIGEVYDMYSMSAAHPTLPLPSYLKVTNTDNGKTVVVRVNDRGPFHQNRIIDLSYAAAYKLGIYQKGVGDVKIEYIDVPKTEENAKHVNDNYVLQVAAISDITKARTLALKLGQTYSTGAYLATLNGLHRIVLGPISNQKQAIDVLGKLKKEGYNTAFMKNYTPTPVE